MTNLSRVASFHSTERIPPSNLGVKHMMETFNGSLRDECLTEKIFDNQADARRTLALWRYDDNNARPYSSLGNKTPSAARHALEQSERAAPVALAQPETANYQPQLPSP